MKSQSCNVYGNTLPHPARKFFPTPNLDMQEKALYKILNAMQMLGVIHIAETRQGAHKPTKRYASSITELDYIESTIKTNPIFHNGMIAPLFQRFIGSIEKQEELDELHAILKAGRKRK